MAHNPSDDQPDQPGQGPDQSPEPGRDQPRGIAGLGSAADDLDTALQRMRDRAAEVEQRGQAGEHAGDPARDDLSDDLDDAALAARFAAIVGSEQWNTDDGTGDGTPAGTSGASEDAEGVTRLLQLLAPAGPDGLPIGKVVSGLGVAPATVYRWLKLAGDKVTQPRRGHWAAAIPGRSDSQ